MVKSNYFSSQEILKRCFVNNTGKLKSSGVVYTAQDYLNAVFDGESDALRIELQGGSGGNSGYWQTPVSSPQDLPNDAEFGSIAPVIDENGFLSFYRKGDDDWFSLSTTSELYSQFIEWGIDNQADLSFLIDKKDEINALLGGTISIKQHKIVFSLENIVKTNLVNDDGEIEQFYDISVDGYALSIQTYADNDAPQAEEYITKTIYNKDQGTFGKTHIYFTKQEFDYYSNLTPPKNVVEIYTIENKNNNSAVANMIKQETIILTPSNVSPVKISIQDNMQNIQDVDDADNDATTHYRVQVSGYVLSVQAYANNDASMADKFLAKMVYDNHNNITNIYLSVQEYNAISNLTPPKNVIQIYYVENKRASTPNVLSYKQLQGVNFSPKHNMIYYYDVTENTNVFFDVSYLNENQQIEFELNLIQHNTAFQVEFPQNFVWSELQVNGVNSSNKMYSIVIRYMNGKFYGRMKAIFVTE